MLQAEEFHSVVHVLLEWLAEAEQALRFHGVLPDDEEALRTLIDQHRVSKEVKRVLFVLRDLLEGKIEERGQSLLSHVIIFCAEPGVGLEDPYHPFQLGLFCDSIQHPGFVFVTVSM